MKMLIVGSDKIYAIENFYVKYLKEMGIDVSHFSAQSLFYDYYQKNIQHKIFFKAGLSKITRTINTQFRQHVEQSRPDVIWIFKGMEILPESLQWVKTKGIRLVNYNPDSPFVFSGAGSGNKNVTESIPFYDLFLTYNPSDKIKMEKEYNIPSAILPFGYDLDEELYERACNEIEKRKLCFLGNPDKYRGRFLEELAEMGLVMDVYGNDWRNFVKHDNIFVNAPVYQDDFWITLRRYRIQLNLMRPHNPESHNMRTFEASGVGAIQLAPETEDHITYFKAGEDIFLYKDIESCFLQAKYLLGLNETEIATIRQATRSRALKNGYSYKARADQALQMIHSLL